MRKQRLLVPFLSIVMACTGYACSGDDDGGQSGDDGGGDASHDAKADGHVGQDGGGHDASVPDSTIPDSSLPDTSVVPDTSVADTSTVDAHDAGDASDGATTNDASDASDGATASDASDAADGATATDGSNDANDGATAADASDGATADAADAAAAAPSVYVLRLGDGVLTLTSAGAPAYLDHYRVTDGQLLNTITLPAAAAGNNQPITFSGTATSEGELTTSVDGHYVVFAGYAAAPGTLSISGSASVSVDGGTFYRRVVARVDANGTVDTSTQLEGAFSGNSVRGVASVDGTAFWVSGTGSSTTGGVHYVGYGLTGTATQIESAVANMRWLGIFGGQLYATTGSGATTIGLDTVGSGTPTTSPQTLTNVILTTGGSPYGFVALDLDSTAGIDTIYLADDRGLPDGGASPVGGVQKFTWSGTVWTPGVVWNGGLSGGVRGLTAYVSGTTVTLVGTTSDNKLVKIVDDGTPTPSFSTLATAASGTVLRGVSHAPTN